VFEDDPDTDQYGGIAAWDVSDIEAPEQAGSVSPPDTGGFHIAYT
jgi:hypothetical protein